MHIWKHYFTILRVGWALNYRLKFLLFLFWYFKEIAPLSFSLHWIWQGIYCYLLFCIWYIMLPWLFSSLRQLAVCYMIDSSCFLYLLLLNFCLNFTRTPLSTKLVPGSSLLLRLTSLFCHTSTLTFLLAVFLCSLNN